MTLYRSRWAGRCYDGPLEGEHHVKESPYFEFQWSPEMFSPALFDPNVPGIPYCYRMAYLWSSPLRAWVFDWRTAPSSRAEQMRRDAIALRSPPKFIKSLRGDWAL